MEDGMPDREHWLLRKIEFYRNLIQNYQEIIGDFKRELRTLQNKSVNDQQNYGGDIKPKNT